MVQPGGRHVQKCFRYLKGKCEKGKDCGFTHSKDDPSKGDLEVQRRMAEKKTRESSGRDASTGVVLGGARLKVLLAPVEASANAETEDWIWDTGAALDVASAAVAGKREVSFAPPILSAGGVVNSVESVVVEMSEIGDTVKAAVPQNTPNALSAGRRCAQQGFSFVSRPWEAKPEDLGTRRDADRVHHRRAFRADRSQRHLLWNRMQHSACWRSRGSCWE